MCLEGYLVSVINVIPGGHYISGLLISILMILALFLAFHDQNSSIGSYLFAYCCPILYLLYYFTMRNSKISSSKLSYN